MLAMSIAVTVVLSAAAFLLGWLLSKRKSDAEMSMLRAGAGTSEALLLRAGTTELELRKELEASRSASLAAAERAALAEGRLTEAVKANEEKIANLLKLEEGLKTSFEALAAGALNANSRHLLDQNKALFDQELLKAQKGFSEKESSITKLLSPINDSLGLLALHSQDLEVKREGAYQSLKTEMQAMQRTHLDLRRETAQLVQALRAPKARGNWGELQLKRCVEFSGMVQHASFDTQRFIRGEDSSFQPDMIVHLPNGRCIVVDAKTPLDAFLSAAAVEDEVQRAALMQQHAKAVQKHLDDLSSKSYWKHFVGTSPDFVVCFLPSEVLFSAALEQDPALLERSAGANVLLATPTTLIALLKAVACGWQQADIARDAQLIRAEALKIQAKLADMHSSFNDLGNALRKAGDKYDDMLVKAEGRGGVFSIARKLRELKAGEKDIGDAKPAALRPRPMEHEDWGTGLALVAVSEDFEESTEDGPIHNAQ